MEGMDVTVDVGDGSTVGVGVRVGVSLAVTRIVGEACTVGLLKTGSVGVGVVVGVAVGSVASGANE